MSGLTGGLALVCAVPAERRALRRLVRAGVGLWVSGMGGRAASRRAAEALSSHPRALVGAGFCGALHPGWAVGEVVVGERVVDGATGEAFAADPALLARTAGRRGTIVSVDRVVRTPAGRALLDGDAVDMESAALARASREAGVPFLAVRAVTDASGHHLPDLEGFVDPAGRLRPRMAARHLARHPADLVALARLGVGSARAGRSLAAAVAPLAAVGAS